MMLNPRIRLFDVLSELARICPEVRVGQLVTNLAYLAKGPSVEAAWDVEDEELLAAAESHLRALRAAREEPVATPTVVQSVDR